MKTLLLLGLMAASSFVCFGQEYAIRGRVSSSGFPVRGAIVTARLAGGPDVSATTDENGEYRLAVSSRGDYSVAVEFRGATVYRGEVRPYLLSGGTRTTHDFDIAGITEVVNVAADQSQPIEQVAKTVNVIDGQEMRDRADITLVDSLRTIPGFRVAQSGGFGRVASIKSRGLRNQDTAILIDGIRFRDATAISGDATSFLSDLTLTSVSKLEVLRGSGSSLYGTNAIGGTVDFQTPRARSGTHGQIAGAFGGLGMARFRGTLTHGTDDGKVGFTSGYSRTGYTKGVDGQDNALNNNVLARIDLNPFSGTNLSARTLFSGARVRLNTDPDTRGILPATNTTIIDAVEGVTFTADANDPDREQRSSAFLGQLQVSQTLSDTVSVSGYYQRLGTRRRNDNGPLGVGFQSASTSVFEGQIDTANAKLSWTPSSTNVLTAGYEFETEDYVNEGRTPTGSGNFSVNANQQSSTFFVQHLARLAANRLTLAGGLRVQKYSLDRPSFSLQNAPYTNLALPNPPTAYVLDGAASYFFEHSGTKLRMHVGNGYRVPSLYERFGTFFSTFPSANFVPIGDPALKPEKSAAFDAGVDQDIAGGLLRLSATYFYTKLTDIIGYLNVAPPIGPITRPFGGYSNQQGGISRGAEFSSALKLPTRTDISSSYTFTNSDQLTSQLPGSGITTTFSIPAHQLTFVATQRLGRAWVNFDFVATSSYLAPIFQGSFPFRSYVYRFDGNRRGDLTGGYTFLFNRESLSLRIHGTIENVFNQRYFENGFRTARATARVGTTFAF